MIELIEVTLLLIVCFVVLVVVSPASECYECGKRLDKTKLPIYSKKNDLICLECSVKEK